MEGDAINACDLQCNIYKYTMEWIFTKCMTMQYDAIYGGKCNECMQATMEMHDNAL